MARIRTVKPEFWTDEKIVEISPLARLLFIGLWNFADDDGRMPFSPTRIKLQILPADNADISVLLGEIRGKGLIEIYVANNEEYLQITNFGKHQKIDKRSPSKLPPPSVNPAESPRITPNCPDGMEGNGREWKGMEETPSSSDDDQTIPPNGFSPDDMAKLWNEAIDFFGTDQVVSIPKVQKVHAARRKKALQRIKDCQIDEPKWRGIINAIHKSPFLSGASPSKDHEGWRANFDFVIRSESVITKILEGGYQ